MGILLGFNFISCSSESASDEIDDGIINNQKKLVQVKTDADYGICWDFSYDSKGRLASVEYRQYFDYNAPDIDASEIELSNIDWGENSIIRTTSRQNYSNDDIVEFSLSDGLIRQITASGGYGGTIVYNSNKQLSVYMRDFGSRTTSLTWGEDNTVVAVKDDHTIDSYTENIIYSDRKCQGYFPIFYYAVNVFVDDVFSLVHPELFGLRTNSLPISILWTTDDGTMEEEYSYTFDKEGYVESCVIRHAYSDGYLSTTNYAFKWE